MAMETTLVAFGKLRTTLKNPDESVVVVFVTPLQIAVTLAPDKAGLPSSGDGFEQVSPLVDVDVTVAWLTELRSWQFAIDASAANTTNTITIIPFPILYMKFYQQLLDIIIGTVCLSPNILCPIYKQIALTIQVVRGLDWLDNLYSATHILKPIDI